MLCPEDREQLTQLELEKALLEQHREGILRQLAESDRALKENAIRRANFALVSRIPDDVLKLIFEQAYQPCQSSGAPFVESTESQCCTQSRLEATHVSRRWRDTAISLPTIWTCVHVEQHIDLLHLWTQRSGALPLHIVYLRTKEACKHQILFLFQHFRRWNTIHTAPIYQRGLDLLDHYQNIGSPAAPLLECVHFNRSNASTSRPRQLDENSGLSFPSLVYLTLINFTVSFGPSELPNLRHLTLEEVDITPAELIELSIAAPQLSILSLHRVYIISDNDQCIVTFGALTGLRFFSMCDWEDILSCINAPCLRTLSCNGLPLRLGFTGFTRTYPSLKHIYLTNCEIEDWDVEDTHNGHVFRCTPSLTYLKLSERTDLDILFTFLNDGLPNGEDVLIPNLETLVIEDPYKEDLDALLPFVRQRSRLSPSSLRELKLEQGLVEALDFVSVQALSELVEVSESSQDR